LTKGNCYEDKMMTNNPRKSHCYNALMITCKMPGNNVKSLVCDVHQGESEIVSVWPILLEFSGS